MRDQALQHHPAPTPDPVSATVAPISGAQSAPASDRLSAELRLFAAIMLGRARPLGDQRERALEWASLSVATRDVASGRAPVAVRRILAFRLLYGAVRADSAAPVPAQAVVDGATWEQALATLLTLPHRRRAAVTLACVLGVSDGDIAAVLGLSPAAARALIDAGVTSVAGAAPHAIDAPAALAEAGARLLTRRVIALPDAQSFAARAVARPAWLSPRQPDRGMAHMPRAMMRASFAPPDLDRPSEPEPVVRQIDVTTAPVPDVQTLLATVERLAPDLKVTPPRPGAEAPAPGAPFRRRRDWREIAVVVAALLVAFSVLLPALNRGTPRADLAAGPTNASTGGGQTVTKPTVDAPGRALTPPRAVRAAEPPSINVRAGDSLWRIADQRLGDGSRWREIWRLNRGRTMIGGARFTNPSLILPSWRLRLPSPG